MPSSVERDAAYQPPPAPPPAAPPSGAASPPPHGFAGAFGSTGAFGSAVPAQGLPSAGAASAGAASGVVLSDLLPPPQAAKRPMRPKARIVRALRIADSLDCMNRLDSLPAWGA